MLRDTILARIAALTDPEGPFNGWRLFDTVTKTRTEEKILAAGRYPEGYDFSALNDTDLVAAFERIVAKAYALH